MKKISKLIPIALAVALVLTAVINSAMPVKATNVAETKDKRIVSTQGEAVVTVEPDMAVITLGVTTLSKSADLAYKENSTKIDGIVKELIKMGVKKEDIQTTSLNLYQTYEWVDNKNQPAGYQASNMISVKVRKIADCSKILESSVLKNANAIQQIQFLVSDNSKPYQEALKSAIKDAETKAKSLVGYFGFKALNPINIKENSTYQPSPIVYNKGMMAEADSVVSAGTMEIRASVSIDFEY